MLGTLAGGMGRGRSPVEGGTRGSWFTTPSLSFGDFDFPPDFFSERKVDFVACDTPSADAFMINVYAAVERRIISHRTKAGLPGASTGHRADSLEVGWNISGSQVERAPDRDTKRCAHGSPRLAFGLVHGGRFSKFRRGPDVAPPRCSPAPMAKPQGRQRRRHHGE
jgi:hypothetical protein